MKKLIVNYTFDKTAKTVTLTDYVTISLERVLLITNVKTNTIIYNFASNGKGGTVAGNALTLSYDTTSMNNTDTLQIFYDDPTSDTQAISAATLPLPTGAATSANQTTGISSLSTIATNTGNGATSANQTSGGQKTQIVSSTGTVAGVDANNNLDTTLGTKLDSVNDSITTYPLGHSYTNITTNATTTVKSGAGVLMGIIINNPALLTVANLTLTIYDNTAASGTKIGTITVPFGLTTQVPFKLPYALAFTTGLTIVTAGPTVTADITVEWR